MFSAMPLSKHILTYPYIINKTRKKISSEIQMSLSKKMLMTLYTWSGIMLGMSSANERGHYYVTSSFIGRSHTQNDHNKFVSTSMVSVNHSMSTQYHRNQIKVPRMVALAGPDTRGLLCLYTFLWQDKLIHINHFNGTALQLDSCRIRFTWLSLSNSIL